MQKHVETSVFQIKSITQIVGETMETVGNLLFWVPESLQMVTVAMTLKDAYSLEGKL